MMAVAVCLHRIPAGSPRRKLNPGQRDVLPEKPDKPFVELQDPQLINTRNQVTLITLDRAFAMDLILI
jgi:hypothetical protein